MLKCSWESTVISGAFENVGGGGAGGGGKEGVTWGIRKSRMKWCAAYFCVGKNNFISEVFCFLVIFQGTVAYVSQQAWIQNATVRDNILFNSAYDCGRYEHVIGSCSLRPDLEILPAGDLTEIGERVRRELTK